MSVMYVAGYFRDVPGRPVVATTTAAERDHAPAVTLATSR